MSLALLEVDVLLDVLLHSGLVTIIIDVETRVEGVLDGRIRNPRAVLPPVASIFFIASIATAVFRVSV